MNKFCLKSGLCSAVMALCVFATAPAAFSMDSETARLLAMGKVLQGKFADLNVSYKVVGRKDGTTALSMTIANSSPTKTYRDLKYVFILRDEKDNILMRCPVKVPGAVEPRQTLTNAIAPLNTDYYILAAQSSYITAQLPAVAWPQGDTNEVLGMSYIAMHSDKYKVKHSLYPLEGTFLENGSQTDVKLADIYNKIQVSAFNNASYEGSSVSLGGQFVNAASLSAYCLAPLQKINMTGALQRSKLALPKPVAEAIRDKMRDLWPEVNRQAEERLKNLAIKAKIDSGTRGMKLTFTLTNDFSGVLKYADVSYWISHPGMLGLYRDMLNRYALNIAPKQTKSFDIDIAYNEIKGEKSVSKDYIKENAEIKVTLYNLVFNEGGKDVKFTPNLDTFIRMNAEIAQ